jgi:hypothetical protein
MIRIIIRLGSAQSAASRNGFVMQSLPAYSGSNKARARLPAILYDVSLASSVGGRLEERSPR